MSTRSAPLLAPPVALDRVPRLVDVLDEPVVAHLDAVLEECLNACRGFLEAEVERRVRTQLDRHAQARFDAWLAQARALWDGPDALLLTPASLAPDAASVVSDPLTVGRTDASPPGMGDQPIDWSVLRERLAICLGNRWPR